MKGSKPPLTPFFCCINQFSKEMNAHCELIRIDESIPEIYSYVGDTTYNHSPIV